jgi:hypothetical protein
MFDSRQYQFSDIEVILGGKDITKIRGIKYTTKQEKEVVHAKGDEPHSIQRGNKTYEGEVTMLQSDYEALVLAGKGSILDLRVNITVNYGNPVKGDQMITDVIEFAEFTEESKEIKQGDKNMEISLPFIALRIKKQVI